MEMTVERCNYFFSPNLTQSEGVDIPDVNTVLFLRPTESSTVFIKQLGRGLRISEDKEVLTVLDFVGQASKNYNYRTKLSSLIGRTHNPLEEEIKNDFPTLLKGCYVALERKATDYILENLKLTYANKRNLLRMIGNFRFESNRLLTLANFLKHYQIEPHMIYKSYSFYKLLNEAGLNDKYEVNDEKLFNNALRKTMQVDSINVGYPLPLELYTKYNTDQVLAALGVHTIDKKMPFREGVKYIEDKNTDILFVTLNKSEKNFSESTMYENYAISDKLFHWQSQSRTSDTSITGQRYINQRANETKVLLFVREYKSENGITSPFYFLGKANYLSHEGSKPISIVWELEEKMPMIIHKKSNKNVG